VKDPPRFVPIPAWARQMRLKVEDRLTRLGAAGLTLPVNRTEWRDRSLGIITSSIAYQYVREVFPNASVLKIGMAYPFPDELIRQFAAGVKKVLVIEELENFLEEHIKAMGIACDGKNIVPAIGELTPLVLEQVKGKLENKTVSIPMPVKQAADLPARPPVLCPSCPHRGVFYALSKLDVVVTGDIGCYSLGVLKPLARIDTILCMGGGVSLAHGMDKAGEKRKVVGMVGDSTFFHSGITGLLDIVYNKGASTIIVVDNRTTAMTGHQDHPGTGKTLMGKETVEASIEAIAKACGVKRVATVDPNNLDETLKVIKQEIEVPEPSLIVARAPCILAEKPEDVTKRVVKEEVCKTCGMCLKLGCPAMEGGGKGVAPRVNGQLCNGCGMCEQVCKFGAIVDLEEI
jgi:indolepyruvate ferredoxin oxidoreductase alpha subunit